MKAAFVPDKCDRDQDENHNEHDPLFVFCEFENPEQTLH
jgi:hypothetical protein